MESVSGPTDITELADHVDELRAWYTSYNAYIRSLQAPKPKPPVLLGVSFSGTAGSEVEAKRDSNKGRGYLTDIGTTITERVITQFD